MTVLQFLYQSTAISNCTCTIPGQSVGPGKQIIPSIPKLVWKPMLLPDTDPQQAHNKKMHSPDREISPLLSFVANFLVNDT